MIKYKLFKEQELEGRHITNSHIKPLNEKHKKVAEIKTIGISVEKKPIYSYTFGAGKKRILVWSQMHGNESTTTKALFDFFNLLHLDNKTTEQLLLNCTFCIIPILNPDGAARYTRLNAKNIDLNRDAQELSQPESRALNTLYRSFKPDYCFNLHGQRTIFSAGFSANSSVLSFLSPAEDRQRAVTKTRKIAMEVIVAIEKALKSKLPEQVSRYDDGFNINCVGDAFQSLQTPTILFEAGHVPGDYKREKTRKHVFEALLVAFTTVSENNLDGSTYQSYFNLPENQKLFFDIIIRNVLNSNNELIDVAIQYNEVLNGSGVVFIPRVAKVGDLTEFFGHKEFDGGHGSILINKTGEIEESLLIINKISINEVDFAKKISI